MVLQDDRAGRGGKGGEAVVPGVPAKSPLTRSFDVWLKRLASLEVTLACLAVLLVLVFLCTLAQVRLGTWGAVAVYIRTAFVWWAVPGTSWHLPVFPGGGLVGFILLVNLAASQHLRLSPKGPKASLWVVHLGLVVLFAGEFVTGFFQQEMHLTIEEGTTKNYVESFRDLELAVVDASPAGFDQVYSFSSDAASRRAWLEHADLPFGMLVKQRYENARLEPRLAGERLAPSLATAGAGPSLVAMEQPRVTKDDEQDQPAVFVELMDGDRSLGTWLLSPALLPQSFHHLEKTFSLALRPKRRYLPFSVTLKDFRREMYPGTEIPKHFSSLVRLQDPARREDREVLITMNHPLRYGGAAFFQASFGKDDTLSVLQVVRNPGWLLPYLACALVGLGLAWHFAARLAPTWRTR